MKFLLLNQCFYPDVMATAQQLTSLAEELVNRGHKVTVITSDRGYEDAAKRFPPLETWKGIRIIRIPSLALGKRTKLRRALNFGSFLIICAWRLLWLPRFDGVLALTSPPLISLLGALFVQLKGGRFYFWVMDLNPDEAIVAGWLEEESLAAKMLGSLLRYSLRHARRAIVLDRFMKERILGMGIPEEQTVVVSPWALGDAIRYDQEGRDLFRRRHQIENRFVVMYSGNHSPCHPLDTLLEAARRLSRRDDIAFCFVGGGSEQTKVKAFAEINELNNLTCLPYQPLDELAGSLSAGDLHTVLMGDEFTGIVHPCKVYNILAIGAPLLYIGPLESHITDIAAQNRNGYKVYQARHGEVDKVVEFILKAAAKDVRSTASCAPRLQSSAELAHKFSRDVLLPRMIELLEGRESSQERIER